MITLLIPQHELKLESFFIKTQDFSEAWLFSLELIECHKLLTHKGE